MALNDRQLKCLKTTGKRYEVADGQGLSVRVSPKGQLTFQMRFRFGNQLCRYDLGTYRIPLSQKPGNATSQEESFLIKGKTP